MNVSMSCVAVLVGFLALGSPVFAQIPVSVPTSVDAHLVLDAAGPEQRRSLTAVYLVACPNVGFGTGFLLETGVIVTNTHVVATCTEQTLVGISTANKQVRFSRIIRDPDRDLALLIPTDKLTGGLKLSTIDSPEPGTAVSTWGYPFGYNGISPLLSVGYVSGFRAVVENGKTVKHIVVNGAFNHGNSGGPLMVSHDNEVIGIVVLTFHFYPPEVKIIIDTLTAENSGFMHEATFPDGSKIRVSDAQLTAVVLNEFYQKTQVMIGEAVAASELAAMIAEHSSELPANSAPANRPKSKNAHQRTPEINKP